LRKQPDFSGANIRNFRVEEHTCNQLLSNNRHGAKATIFLHITSLFLAIRNRKKRTKSHFSYPYDKGVLALALLAYIFIHFYPKTLHGMLFLHYFRNLFIFN